MSAKHTPGPWHVDSTHNEGEYGSGPDTHSGFKSFVVFDDDGRSLFDSTNSEATEVAEAFDEDSFHAWDAVGLANLTLAAAAPELLAGLRSMLDWLDDGNRVLSDACAADVASARAAITKATGGA
jgi:hypothetical protein